MFLYFIPTDRPKVTPDDIRSRDLAYAFGGDVGRVADLYKAVQVYNGPSGQNGVVVSREIDGLGYYPDKQTWKPEVGHDHWVGMYSSGERRPTPDRLARDSQIEGKWIQADDGSRWLAPRARHWEEFEGEPISLIDLPTRFTRNAEGEWNPGEVKPRYQRLWQLAEAFMEAQLNAEIDDQGNWRFRFEQINALAIECLTCNYRVSETEVDLLGIYDVEFRRALLDVLLDNDGFESLLKKKLAHDGGDSFSGPQDSSPANQANTAQQSPT